MRNNLAWKNKAEGFNENASAETKPETLHNNTAWNNGGRNYGFYLKQNTFRNNLSHGSPGVSASGSDTNNSWSLPVTVANDDFSLDDACARGPRKADGSLPDCSFLRLVAGSDLIDKGVSVGIPYSGNSPDLGAYERP